MGTAALVVSIALPTVAFAEPRIERIRLGRHPDYSRIVLDVEGGASEAYVTREPARLHIEAEPPSLDAATQRSLAALGVRLEPSDVGTLLTVDTEAPLPWTAFRLAGESVRIVLDLGSGSPGLPPDAEPLPVRIDPEQPLESGRATESNGASVAQRKPEPRTPGIRVRPSGITFVGLSPAGPSRDELMDLELRVRLAPGGDWEDVSGAGDAQTLSLHQLTSAGPESAALTGGVLQQVVNRIAALYMLRGRLGTRVEIRRDDFERLAAAGGPLVVHIEEPAAIPE